MANTDMLNVARINALKPRERDYKVTVGRGLCLADHDGWG